MSLVSCIQSIGKGRSIVFITCSNTCSTKTDSSNTNNPNSELSWINSCIEPLSSFGTVHHIVVPELDHQEMNQCFEEFTECLEELKIRQATFVTVGRASILLWKLALTHQRQIRNALIINGETRPKVSWFEKILQRIESYLPLGLPFRVSEGKFYALPFLERFRFPVIVVTTEDAIEDEREESARIAAALPVAWSLTLTLQDAVTEFVAAYNHLISIPPKRPQKRRKKGQKSEVQIANA